MAAPLLVLTSSSSTAGVGTTLAALRHDLADQLGLYRAARVSAVPSAGDTTRYVLSDDLADDEEQQPFARAYLYVYDGAQAGAQRRMARDGYLGPQSAVRLTRPLAATLAINTTVEVTSPLPVRRYLNVKGLNDCLDEALARLPVIIRIPFTGDGSRSYSLAAYEGLLQRYEQTRGIYDSLRGGTTIPPSLSPRPYALVGDGASLTLQPSWSYASGDTFYLEVATDADRVVYDGTAWAYATTRGLRNTDTYATAAHPRWVLVWAMVKALQEVRTLILADTTLDERTQARRLDSVARRIASWGTAAKRIIAHEFPKPVQEPSTLLRNGTVLTPSVVPVSSPWPG